MENNIALREKKTKYSLYTVYTISYGAMACFFPFLPYYLKLRGLDYVQVGYCLSITSIVSIIAQPFWGYLSDRKFGKRKVIFSLFVLCGLSSISFLFANSFTAIALSIMLLIAFQGAVFPLADSYVYALNSGFPSIQYGKVRLFGSAGFAVITFLLGFLLKHFDVSFLFIGYLCFMLTAAFIFTSVKFSGKSEGASPHFHDIKKILKNPTFLLFIFTVCISSVGAISNGNYIAILVEKTGGNTGNLGTLWLLVALSELPLFYYGNILLKRFGEDNLYIFAMIIYAIRFFASALCVSFIPVMLIQLLQTFTFPLFALATTSRANKLLPDNLKATGMTLMTSLGYGLGGLIGNFFGGFIIKLISVFFLYKIYGGLCLFSILLVLYMKKSSLVTSKG